MLSKSRTPGPRTHQHFHHQPRYRVSRSHQSRHVAGELPGRRSNVWLRLHEQSCDDGPASRLERPSLEQLLRWDVPAQSFAHCFTTYVFQNNGLIASPSAFPESAWPKENLFPATVLAVGLSTTTTATAEIMRCYRAARTRTRARTAKILEPILPDSLQRWLECNKSVPVPHPKVRGFSRDLIFCLLQRDFISLKTTVISSKWGMLQEKTRMVRTGWLFPRSIPFHCSLLFAVCRFL